MLNENFVYLGAAASFVGQISYILATLRGNTKPNRISFFLWAAAPFLALAGSLDEGVGLQALLTFMVGFGPALIFIASFVNPQSFWKITKLDIACGVLSVCGLLVWLITQEGNTAIAAGIAADGLASVPVIVKAYKHPHTEHSWLYWLAGVNAAITLLTIDHWTFAHYAFPTYILVVCLLLGTLVTFRIEERLRRTNQPPATAGTIDIV